jgi:IclR family transcriptional regulator, pca regulon regulatory protein
MFFIRILRHNVPHSNPHSCIVSADPIADGPKPSDSYVQSLARGLSVLTSFSARAPQQTLTQVATATGLTRAGARRALLTLQALGYVGSDGKLFCLTPKTLDLGFAYLSGLPLWHLAEPAMEALSAATGESCSAAVLDGAEIVYVLRMPTRKVMSISLGVGSRLPAHCTSMGRMLLSALPDGDVLQCLAQRPPQALTPKTQTEPDMIVKKVQTARRQGWCLVDQELEEGLISMAAPVRDRAGRMVAALNVSGQANRTSARQMQSSMLKPLLDASAQISALLGYRSVST